MARRRPSASAPVEERGGHLGRCGGESEGHAGAVGEAADVGGLDVEVVEQRAEVVDMAGERDRALSERAAALSTGVVDDHTEAVAKGAGVAHPVGRGLRQTVEEDERSAFAVGLGVEGVAAGPGDGVLHGGAGRGGRVATRLAVSG